MGVSGSLREFECGMSGSWRKLLWGCQVEDGTSMGRIREVDGNYMGSIR